MLDGRFGPYITDGTVNASVPRGIDPETVSLEQAVELLRERAARAPATKKKAPAKRTAKKATKKASPPKSMTTRTVKKRAAKKADREEGPVHVHPFRDETSCSGYVDADDRRAAGSSREAPFIPSDSSEPPLPEAPWRVFGTKSFFRLWSAQFVSSLGDWIGLIAILAIAARVSDNSGAAVSLVMTTACCRASCSAPSAG